MCTLAVFVAYVGLLLGGEASARPADLVDANIVSVVPPPAETDQERMIRLVDYIEGKYPVNRRVAEMIVGQAFAVASREQLTPELLLAVIAVESGFRIRVVSRAGARGLMQIVPKWHPVMVREIGGAQALFDPEKNIRAGFRILVDYLRALRGDLRGALLKYNGSLGNPRSRYADKVLSYQRRLLQVASAI
jgi:soluble lytic murein transglycosylase-like protein